MSTSTGIPREIWYLLLMELMMFTVWNLMISSFQGFVDFLSGSSSALGYSFGVFALFSVSFRILAGRLLGRANDGLVLSFGVVMLVVPVLIYVLADSMPVVYVGRAIHGTAWAFATVAMMTIAVRAAPSARLGEIVGYVNSVNFATMIVFPGIGSAMVDATTLNSFQVFFSLEFLLSLAVCPLAFLVWRAVATGDLYELRSSDHFVSRQALLPTLAVFLVCFGFGGVLSYSPDLAILHNAANPGLFIALVAVGQLLGATVGGRLSDRRGYSRVSLLGTVLVVAGLLIAAIGNSPATYVASSALFGLGLGFVTIALTALSALFVEVKDKPLAMATFSAGFDGGIMVGSFAIAAMIESGMSLTVGLLVAGLIALASVAVYHPLKGRETRIRFESPSAV